MRQHAGVSLRQRLISTISVTAATTANMISYAGVVVAGVFAIAAHNLTMGGLERFPQRLNRGGFLRA